MSNAFLEKDATNAGAITKANQLRDILKYSVSMIAEVVIKWHSTYIEE
jgi:hypothetical protein